MNTKIHYQIIPSKSGIPTVQAQVAGAMAFYLHSSVHPRKEADDWVKRMELTPDTCYVVLGIGLGYHVEALLKSLPLNSRVLVIHTKSEDLLMEHIRKISKAVWQCDKRLEFLHLTSIHDMAILTGNIMIKNIIKKICLCRHFPTMRLAEQEYLEIENTLVASIEKLMAINFNIRVTTEHQFLQNYWRNFAALVLNSDCRNWTNAFADLPVIMVAAGPSLNKNIAELKKCVDKAIIIAAGSALGALHKHGITPHFLVVTDATPAMYDEVKGFFSSETILVTSTNVQYKIVENYPGRKCFFETWRGYDDEFRKYLPEPMQVRQTGSVATAAVDFANQCGARTIIFVGQDLAFSDKESHHAEGVQAGDFGQVSNHKVPGYYGGEVNTYVTFSIIIDHYNLYVKKHSHIDFINATEGGALISSMRNLPLKSVRQQMLKKTVDINKLYMAFKKYDSGIQLDRILKHLKQLSNWIMNLGDQLDDFCNKEQAIINEDNQRAVILEDIQRFEKFYEQMKRRSAYPYIRSSVEGWEGLLKFQTRDGMPIDMQYGYYTHTTKEIKEVLTNLATAMADNIETIEGYKRGQQ